MSENRIKKELLSSVQGKLFFDKPLRDCTYFKIGGKARAWIEPVDSEDLKNTLSICKTLKLPVFLFGGGSNLLVNDQPIEKAVIRLSGPLFKKISFNKNRITCSSGVAISDLVRFSIKQGLGGLEFLAGVPGTVGGALAMNAGGGEKSIGKLVEWAKTMDYNGRIKEFGKDELQFRYRESNISGRIILEARFKLKKTSVRTLKERFHKVLSKKARGQELAYPNAGCIFKNPAFSTRTTGELIESVGLKGARIGDAQISELHANFILNLGKASFEDVRKLMKLAQSTVKRKYNLWLKPEVKIIN